MAARLGDVGNPSSLHASGRAARRLRRGVPRALAAGARGPAQRGRLHRRRHRVGQPRGQGPLLAAPRRGPGPAPRILASAVEHHAVLDAGRVAGRARGRRRRVAAGRPGRPGAPRDAAGGHRARPRRRRAGHASCGPTTRSAPSSRSRELADGRARARHADPLRRGAGGRAAPGRLRGQRPGRDDRDRAQARRAARRRRAGARPRGRPGARPARRRAGARRALRHPRRARRSSGFAVARPRSPSSAEPSAPSGSPVCATTWSPGARGRAGRRPQR